MTSMTNEERKAKLEADKLEAEIANLKVEREYRAVLTQKEQAIADKERSLGEIEKLSLDDRLTSSRYSRTSNNNYRVLDLLGTIGGTTSEASMTILGCWARQSLDPITIRISSGGGSIIDGLAVYDYIQAIRAHGIKVTTLSLGYAASMAGVLMQAGDHRVMSPNSYLLIHETSAGAGGKISEMEDETKWVRALNERIMGILASRSTMTQSQITKKAERRDWWLDPIEALKLGFIDESGYAGAGLGNSKPTEGNVLLHAGEELTLSSGTFTV